MTKDSIIIEGNTYEEALNLGLKQLGIDLKKADVEILIEKKATIFRKGYVKLKISKKDTKNPENHEEITNIGKKVNTSTLENNKFFKLDFLSDGVYITILESDIDNIDIRLKSLTDYLFKKSVKNYDLELIKKSLLGGINIPVKIAPYQEELIIDSEVFIEITKDKLEAYITIFEGDGGKELSLQDIEEKLKENGIIFGVNKVRIQEILENKLYKTKFLIAEGNKPQHGENGKIIYHFEINKDYKPELLEDGTVDFKHLNLINNVKKGQLLAEIIPPSEGVTGLNVLGEEIPAIKGKPARVIKGKNVCEDETGLKLYADVDGQVFLRDGKLQVSEIYEVPGDVDHSVGNIDFNGKVVVRGNVKSGFTVKADGDIEVNGVVEGAMLIAKGNIILKRGIQGNNQAYLECGGNLISKYIENSTIKSMGNIEADCILHSNIIAKGSIKVNGKRGLIVGGQIRATEEIRSKILGSHMGTITVVEVGIDPDEKSRYERIKKEVEEIEKNLSNLKKTIELLGKLAKSNSLPEEKEEILVKSIKTYEFLKEKHVQLQNELQMLEYKMQNLSSGKVHVSDKVYPGTKITILNAVRHIYNEINHSTFSKKEGDIVIGPYEK